MNDISLFQALDWVARVCLAFSILNAILPPYEILNDFPSAQKYYKVLLAVVRYFSADVRTKVMSMYPSFNESMKTMQACKEEMEARSGG